MKFFIVMMLILFIQLNSDRIYLITFFTVVICELIWLSALLCEYVFFVPQFVALILFKVESVPYHISNILNSSYVGYCVSESVLLLIELLLLFLLSLVPFVLSYVMCVSRLACASGTFS